MRKDYLDLGFKPREKDIVAEYLIRPAKGVTIEEAANAVAGESSIDTWSDIKTLSPSIVRRLRPHVYYIKEGIVRIAHPIELFELGSVPQLLSSLAGNILSMKLVESIRLRDIKFPKAYVQSFEGPLFGIQGIRGLLKISNRPLLGTIVKPKLGLSCAEHAEVARRAWVGGVDIVKDDENLTDQGFNRFRERVRLTLKARDEAERIARSRKVYMANITAPTTEEMLARAEYVKSLGGEYIMVDIIPMGWAALQSLRKANNRLRLVLHAHRCMHSAFTRSQTQGVSMLVVAKLARLIGLDQLHIGTIMGKMEGGESEVLGLRDEIELSQVPKDETLGRLEQQWYKIKPMMAVASGGLHPIMLPQLYKYFGNDIIFQFGGGIHAHPMGTEAGARAVKQALEATLKCIPLIKYAEGRAELAAAIKKWG